MKAWLSRLWNDSAFFQKTMCAVLAGYGVAATSGALPTGIPGGQRYAWVFTMLAAFFGAGGSSSDNTKT